jgi:hypothetical protein
MKPCSKNREPIALLAAGALEARLAEELRRHFEHCEGCLAYWEDMVRVAERLAAPPAPEEIHASERFHRRVVAALGAEQRRSPPGNLRAVLGEWWATQRLAPRLAWGLAVVLLIVAGVLLSRSPRGSGSDEIARKDAVHAVSAKQNRSAELPPPSLANYQRFADRSLEALDELLERQAERVPGSTAVYTAGERSL